MTIIYQTKEEIAQKANDIIHSFQLWDAMRYYNDGLINASTNDTVDLPYHNRYHTMSMVVNCYDASQYYNLPWQTIRTLLTAAIFHDYRHTGGKEPDNVNISRAVSGFLKFSHGSDNQTEVVQHIRCTEYPFKIAPVSIEQKILRDSDLVQGLMPDGWDMVMNKLKEELEVSYRRLITDQEMIAGQLEFMSKIHFYTDWAEDNFRFELRKFIHNLSCLVEE